MPHCRTDKRKNLGRKRFEKAGPCNIIFFIRAQAKQSTYPPCLSTAYINTLVPDEITGAFPIMEAAWEKGRGRYALIVSRTDRLCAYVPVCLCVQLLLFRTDARDMDAGLFQMFPLKLRKKERGTSKRPVTNIKRGMESRQVEGNKQDTEREKLEGERKGGGGVKSNKVHRREDDGI